VLWVGDFEPGRVVANLGKREGWVAVGAERAVGVEGDPPCPAQDAEVEIEDAARIALREEDGEEGDHAQEDEREPEEDEDDEVRDREQPLDKPEPAAQGRSSSPETRTG
jgi:hypothetical protein